MKQPIIPCAFSYMMMDFNETVKEMPEISKVKDKLLNLKKDAINNIELNGRQRESITARVDNYLNGTYGKTKDGVQLQTK